MVRQQTLSQQVLVPYDLVTLKHLASNSTLWGHFGELASIDSTFDNGTMVLQSAMLTAEGLPILVILTASRTF